jgi:hypothetical protein
MYFVDWPLWEAIVVNLTQMVNRFGENAHVPVRIDQFYLVLLSTLFMVTSFQLRVKQAGKMSRPVLLQLFRDDTPVAPVKAGP